MKREVLVGILALLVIVFVFLLMNLFSVEFTGNVIQEGTKFENSDKCGDSDGGIFAFQKGIVTTKNFLGIPMKYADRCQDVDGKDAVREYYCENGKAKWQKIACEKGCENGACKPVPVARNIKDMTKYATREVFLVSDKDWKDVLPLVPVTTWTGSEKECTRGYGTPENVCVYPTLVWHEESKSQASTFTIKDANFEIVTLFPDPNNKITLHLEQKQINLRETVNVPLQIKNAGTTVPNFLVVFNSFDPDVVVASLDKTLNIKNVGSKYYISSSNSGFKLQPGETKEIILSITFDTQSDQRFDADSIIYFMQQYQKDGQERVMIVGQTPQELDDLLVAKPEFGAGLAQDKIQRISSDQYLSYWKSYSTIVYVEDNYELALLASTYASLINAPLVIKGTVLDVQKMFAGKEVICVGSAVPQGSVCKESYTLEQLQKKYVEVTKTDKIILVNPMDLSIKVIENFKPEKSASPVLELYSKTSLIAPILASAKHEILFFTHSSNYLSVVRTLEETIDSLSLHPQYLTIFATSDAVEMGYKDDSTFDSSYSTDAWQYSRLKSNSFLQLATGRIFSLTLSDVSSYLARDLFYDVTLKNSNSILTTVGDPFITISSEIYGIGTVFSSLGYDTTIHTIPHTPQPDEWKNKFFIHYNDHGGPSWLGFESSQIPSLDNSFIFTEACSTCDSRSPSSSLFCSRALRKGAIGYIGAVEVSGYINQGGFIAETFAQHTSLGMSFKNSKNAVIFFDRLRLHSTLNYNPMPWYMLLGDPTLTLSVLHPMPQPQLTYLGGSSDTRDAILTIPLMKVNIPEKIKVLNEIPSQTQPFYFSTSNNIQPNINNEFISLFSFSDSFKPVAGSNGVSILKEDDSHFWLKFQSKESIFSDESNDRFASRMFKTTLYSKLPDFSIESVRLKDNLLSFELRNIGNAEGTTDILHNIISITGNFARDLRYAYYFDHPMPRAHLLPGESIPVSLSFPNVDSNGVKLSDQTVLKVYISFEFAGDFFQQNNTDYWEGELTK